MLPKISILIPCYNAEQWIAQAIGSALNQTYLNKEVIVVDDGSTDGSLEIIKNFGDSIRWETGANRGGNIARNRLLELSTGEWLQYLDADDYLLKDKIAKQVQYLTQFPQTDILYSPSILESHEPDKSSQTPSILESHEPDKSSQTVLPIPEPHDPWILLARWYLPQTGSPLWRKQAILDVGGWKPDQPCCQEHELYLRLLMAEKRFDYCCETGSVYRQWSETTLCKKDRSQTYLRRLAITDQLEEYLETIDELTTPRQQAINQARFECARIIWLSNPTWADKLINQIKHREPKFIPTGHIAPRNYRLIYQLFGFSIAENIAIWKRKLHNILSFKLTTQG